jgi:hypothetical protein
LYKEYAVPLPRGGGLVLNPATALCVLEGGKHSGELERSVLACVTRDGIHNAAPEVGACTWDGVLEQVPGMNVTLKKLMSPPHKEQVANLAEIEVYMSMLGEVTPGWYQKEAASGGSG